MAAWRRLDDGGAGSPRAGVTRSTLYAYVSRGLVRSASVPGRAAAALPAARDRALALERERARNPALVARASLDWGRPVLNSELTLIEDGRLYYRGRDAIELSRHATLEDVAALLLACDRAICTPARRRASTPRGLRALARLDPIPACTAGFAWLHGLDDGAASRDAARSTAARCGRLLRLMTAVVARRSPDREPAHRQLARAWQLDEHGAELVRQALVLCADHELTPPVSPPAASRRPAPSWAPASPRAWRRCPARATAASPRPSNRCGIGRSRREAGRRSIGWWRRAWSEAMRTSPAFRANRCPDSATALSGRRPARAGAAGRLPGGIATSACWRRCSPATASRPPSTTPRRDPAQPRAAAGPRLPAVRARPDGGLARARRRTGPQRHVDPAARAYVGERPLRGPADAALAALPSRIIRRR